MQGGGPAADASGRRRRQGLPRREAGDASGTGGGAQRHPRRGHQPLPRRHSALQVPGAPVPPVPPSTTPSATYRLPASIGISMWPLLRVISLPHLAQLGSFLLGSLRMSANSRAEYLTLTQFGTRNGWRAEWSCDPPTLIGAVCIHYIWSIPAYRTFGPGARRTARWEAHLWEDRRQARLPPSGAARPPPSPTPSSPGTASWDLTWPSQSPSRRLCLKA